MEKVILLNLYKKIFLIQNIELKLNYINLFYINMISLFFLCQIDSLISLYNFHNFCVDIMNYGTISELKLY